MAARPAPAGDPFEALGDPNRRAIVELLAAAPPDGRSVGELARVLPISRPAVSRHLRLLKAAGLVVEEPRGTRRLYRLHDAGPQAVRSYLERVWGEAMARFRLVAENTQPTTALSRPGGARRTADRAKRAVTDPGADQVDRATQDGRGADGSGPSRTRAGRVAPDRP